MSVVQEILESCGSFLHDFFRIIRVIGCEEPTGNRNDPHDDVEMIFPHTNTFFLGSSFTTP